MTRSVENALDELVTLNGIICAALVDSETGSILGEVIPEDHAQFDVDVAAAGNSRVMQEKLQTIQNLHLQDAIEDIFITLGEQYHIIRPIPGQNAHGMFLYCVLEKNNSNPLLAQKLLKNISTQISFQPIDV